MWLLKISLQQVPILKLKTEVEVETANVSKPRPRSAHYVDAQKNVVYHEAFDIVAVQTGCKLIGERKDLILSWKFDPDQRLFVLIRDDGVQYLRCSFRVLSSLPYYELRRLTGLDLTSRGAKDEDARQMDRNLGQEFYHKNFVFFTPTYGKNKTFKDEINPRTGEPKIRTVYPPVKSLKAISLLSLPEDCLTNFKCWWFCFETQEVIITDNDKGNILFFHDPIHWVNLSKADLRVLRRNRLLYSALKKKHAPVFEHVVHVCVMKGYHSGNLLLKT